MSEVVTRGLLRFVNVAGLDRPGALITLDNGHDHTKPNTFGPAGIAGLDAALDEAFAVQVLAFLDHFGIADDDPRVNPWGGAIAVGHPLASSGVRLMTQLARHFAEHPEVRYGLTAMCIGIGMGGTVIWENPNWEGGK